MIKRSDIWRIIPYENRIGVANLTMPELKDILEENAGQIGSVHFLGVYGLSYELHPNAPPGERVRNLRLADGSKPHARKRFRVAMNSYALASGGGRFPLLRKIVERPESRLEMTDIDTRTAVIEYVRKHSPLQIDAGADVTVVRRKIRSGEGCAVEFPWRKGDRSYNRRHGLSQLSRISKRRGYWANSERVSSRT